jgi:hypothetical protein
VWTSYDVWVPTNCGRDFEGQILDCTSKTVAWQGTGVSYIRPVLFEYKGGPIVASIEMYVTLASSSVGSFPCGSVIEEISADVLGLTGTYGSILGDVLNAVCN